MTNVHGFDRLLAGPSPSARHLHGHRVRSTAAASALVRRLVCRSLVAPVRNRQRHFRHGAGGAPRPAEAAWYGGWGQHWNTEGSGGGTCGRGCFIRTSSARGDAASVTCALPFGTRRQRRVTVM